MRYKATFVVGLAAGYVLGTAAGRERYEQMKKMAQQAANHPAVQQATQTASVKAAEFGKAAGQKAAERMPRLAETAKSSAAMVRGQLDRRKGGVSADGTEAATVNGARPTD